MLKKIYIFFIFITLLNAKILIVPLDFNSIQDAIEHTSNGDTVFVKNGVYKENIRLADNIHLIGENNDKTIIKAKKMKPVVIAANNSTLSNFTITEGYTGILSENTNMLIINNKIIQNKRTGIQCILSLPEIRNNIIALNGWSGIFCELVAYGSRTAVENNLIAENGYSGIFLSRKSGILIQNNVFFKNKQFGIFVSPDSRKSRIIYNDFYMNRRSYNNYAIIDATNISIDPKLPLKKSYNFSELINSNTPLLNKGKNNSPIGIVSLEKLATIFTDSDEDGIPDNNDMCPDKAEDFDKYQDNDGCPDMDNDSDGIFDNRDRCPDISEDFDGFRDADGCPDKDNDSDGIIDNLDKCPNVKENINGITDDDGCPD